MPGPPPKDPKLRQRVNKKSTAAQLTAPENPEVHPLPDVGRVWRPLTLAWWKRVWASHMASEFLDTDVDGLVRVALLVDDLWLADSARERAILLGELRLQEARFGLSPLDRSRLHWEIAKGEEADRKRRKPEPPKRPERLADPRSVLKAVT